MTTTKHSEHTALPWEVVACEDERHHSHAIMSVELSRKMDAGEPAPHPLLASVRFGRGHVSASEALANARFIVTACNSHDDLVSTLRNVGEYLESIKFQANQIGEYQAIHDKLVEIGQALALAEGRDV